VPTRNGAKRLIERLDKLYGTSSKRLLPSLPTSPGGGGQPLPAGAEGGAEGTPSSPSQALSSLRSPSAASASSPPTGPPPWMVNGRVSMKPGMAQFMAIDHKASASLRARSASASTGMLLDSAREHQRVWGEVGLSSSSSSSATWSPTRAGSSSKHGIAVGNGGQGGSASGGNGDVRIRQGQPGDLWGRPSTADPAARM
jgi:hypothetical protein